MALSIGMTAINFTQASFFISSMYKKLIVKTNGCIIIIMCMLLAERDKHHMNTGDKRPGCATFSVGAQTTAAPSKLIPRREYHKDAQLTYHI